MLKRDYILNVIEQFGQAIAHIISSTNLSNYNQAQDQIQQTAQEFLGLSLASLENDSSLDLLSAVRTGRLENDIANWVLLVDLLRVRGDLYRATLQEKAAVNLYLKALDSATEVAQKEEIFPYFQGPIHLVVERLANYVTPFPIAEKLFLCYELGGEYAQAEDLLFDLLETSGDAPAVIEMGLAFYDRLWKLSDFRLLQGGLSRTEVEESMGELLDMV